jgi:hypothetical protein
MSVHNTQLNASRHVQALVVKNLLDQKRIENTQDREISTALYAEKKTHTISIPP